jgi:hypothetical protein
LASRKPPDRHTSPSGETVTPAAPFVLPGIIHACRPPLAVCFAKQTSLRASSPHECDAGHILPGHKSKIRFRGFLLVPRRGLEPPCRCQRYHLKVVRLPVSPPGHICCVTRTFNLLTVNETGRRTECANFLLPVSPPGHIGNFFLLIEVMKYYHKIRKNKKGASVRTRPRFRTS